MKKLSEKDYALLRSRGVTSFITTVTTFDIPSLSPKKKVKKVYKPKNPNAKHPLVGKILHSSWGYDMTINEFCKIIEVSPTGKTCKCRMVGKEGFNGYQGKVSAGNVCHGPEFRLKIKENNYFNGSYPFVVRDTKEKSSFRMGYFSVHSGGTVYENHMD